MSRRGRNIVWRELSLTTWLVLVQSGVLLVLAASLGVAAWLFGRAAIEDGAETAVEIAAQARKDALLSRLEGVRSRADSLLSLLDARCGSADAACERQLLENFVRIQGAVAARLVSPAGVAGVGDPSLAESLVTTPAPRPPAVATVRALGQEHVLVVPVTSGARTLSLLLDHAAIDPIFANREAMGEGGETFLADERGYFVTPGRYAADEGRSHPIDVRPMAECLSGRGGSMVAPDYRGVQTIHGYRPTPELGGGCVMAHIVYTEALAPASALGSMVAAITTGGLALAILASALLARRLDTLLARLARRAEALAAGDLESPVTVEGPAELRAYARVFAKMAGALRERIAALDTAHAELEGFNASVTHDLRGPLRAIDGFCTLLLERTDELSPENVRLLLRIHASARRMAHLVDDLLVLARVSRAELTRERVDLTELARAVGAELAGRAGEHVVRLSVAPGLEAEGDPGLLRIVLENLLANAWKFTRTTADARVEVFATRTDDATTFVVRDNGVGFDPTLAGRLFQPFSRLHSTAEFEGTGIGLATVARIVRRHGGTVRAEATLGGGASFFFTLPPARVLATPQ